MPASFLGLLTGLIAGLAWALGGFGDFVIVLVLGAVGYVVGRVLEGSLDVSRYVGDGRRDR